MDPITGAALIGVGGNLLGGLMGSSAQKKANKTNLELQQRQLSWQEKMANSEWQRGIADMKAAGMNPMLAFSQGGASTPNVSAATAQPVDALARSVSSAGEKAAQTIALQQQQANTKLILEQARKAGSEADVAAVTAANAANRQHYEIEEIKKRIEGIISSFHLSDEQRRQIHELLPFLTRSAKAEASISELGIPSAQAEADWWKKMQDVGGSSGAGSVIKEVMNAIIQLMRVK